MENIFFQPAELGVSFSFLPNPHASLRELIVGSIETKEVNKML